MLSNATLNRHKEELRAAYSLMREYVREIDTLEAENRTLRFKIQSLETSIKALEEEVEELKSRKTGPSCRSQVIDALQAGLKTTGEIHRKTGLGRNAVRSAIYNLYEVGVLIRTGPHRCGKDIGGVEYHYFLKEEKR